ncbi:DNA/RNA non-specific endonuclease [uncultured Cohaesibacter sp.]|uniref:DNA/RNA non-specific endonuclease n=1 Tax=uncultured Cohaesibacter sp. TaxID=1002546 RepID=UPI00292E61D7|nr:DNA/RNA non-specific endonuclease [uncultured Cohaesibacter sp.]
MMRLFITSILLCLSWPALADCSSPLMGGREPTLVIDTRICEPGYTIGYSDLLRSPLWVAQYLTPASIQEAEAYNRDCYIKAFDGVTDGAENSDYEHSGYDRGHMAPAGDFGINQQQTCHLANMVPQLPDLNRKLWRSIERQTRDLAEEHGGAFIISGPLYGGVPDYLSQRIPIPEAIFKIVVTEKGAWAYVATNHEPIECRLTSIDRLEAERGAYMVPALSEDQKQFRWIPEPVTGCLREEVQ